MSLNRARRAFALALGSSALLAACGGSTVASKFDPKRLVVFGDATADIGRTGTRYTVNNGSINIWTLQLASRWGLPLAPAPGGTSWATAHARVLAQPDAIGGAAATVKEQIDAFLAGGGTFREGDLVIVSAGVSDLIVQAVAVFAGRQTVAQATANLEQAGRDLAEQVRRLVQAGAEHVAVAGPYNMGRTPWAISQGQTGQLQAWSTRFNDLLLVGMVDLGTNVLYVDRALYYNLVTASPASYGMSNATTPVCNSVDALGPGIGIGAGQVNSGMCDATTLIANADAHVFADAIYPSPQAQRLFGDYAYERVRQRW